MQWDDRGGQGLRQRQQAVRQRDQRPVTAVQEGGDDLREYYTGLTAIPIRPYVLTTA